MTNKEYRELIRQDAPTRRANLIYFLDHKNYKPIHHYIWLRLMGLMETWDIRR